MSLLDELKLFVPMAKMIAPTRPTLPLLKRIRFADGHVTATDLHHYVVMPVSEDETYMVKVKTIADILKNKPENLEITVSGGATEPQSLRIRFDGINAMIAGHGLANEFPKTPQSNKRKFHAVGIWIRDFVGLLEQQIPFICKDELKPALMGAYLDIKDSVATLVATDGHKMRYTLNHVMAHRSHLDFQRIIALKTIEFLAKFMGKDKTVLVSKSDEYLRFALHNGVVLYARRIDERYPDYKSILPEGYTSYAIFDRDTALRNLRALRQFCNQGTKAIRINIKPGEMTAVLVADDPETASNAVASLEFSEKNGEIAIGFDLDHLITVIKSCGKTVRWDYGSPVQASWFYEDGQSDVRVLLMPVRLND